MAAMPLDRSARYKMAIKFFGWGRWGNRVLDRLLTLGRTPISGILDEYIHISEERYAAAHFPDSLAAEVEFLRQKDSWGKLLAGESGLCRAHFLNMGENFSSGAIISFLKNQPAYKETLDLLIAYMPPPGSNPPAVGRLLANIYGQRKFADITILLDGCAPFFSECDEDDIAFYAVSLGSLLKAFERSGCMIPLLLRMGRNTLLPAFADTRKIKADCSLESLWRALALSGNGCAAPPGGAKDFLAFSVSEQREENLARIYERNFRRDQLVYLPFFRKYEWRELSMPHTREDVISNFTGVFCAAPPPERARKFLAAYLDAYWAEEEWEGLEKPDVAVWEWLCRKGLAARNSGERYFLKNKYAQVLQDIDLAQTALRQIAQ